MLEVYVWAMFCVAAPLLLPLQMRLYPAAT